jgi:hypothetical protein
MKNMGKSINFTTAQVTLGRNQPLMLWVLSEFVNFGDGVDMWGNGWVIDRRLNLLGTNIGIDF